MKKTIFIWFFLAVFVLGKNIVVKSSAGKIEGVLENQIAIFKGIPFAKAPIDHLRWQAAVPKPAWSGVYEAKKFGPKCTKPNQPESQEDCLCLNVWAPKNSQKLLPVMVYVHGGAFKFGSGNMSGEHLPKEGVVLLSFNYRLGPLGFFSHPATQSKLANFVLTDMLLALKWVQDNIKSFGGDPNNVTIFGISAGGNAVNLLMVNDDAQSLFHKAISQSGYATWALPRKKTEIQGPLWNLISKHKTPLAMDWKAMDTAESQDRHLLNSIGVKDHSLKTLAALPAKDLVKAHIGPYLPIVDGLTLKEEPGLLFLRERQHLKPYISGGCSFELSVFNRLQLKYQMILDYLNKARLSLITAYGSEFGKDVQKAANDPTLAAIFGDARYILSGRFLVESMIRRKQNAWLYMIDYNGFKDWQALAGTPHGGDYRLLFANTAKMDKESQALALRIRQYWVNFAKTGDPNHNGLKKWPVYDLDQQAWMVFGKQDQVLPKIRKKQLDFLEKLYYQRLGLKEM